jgi:hypothetical protein
MKFKLLISIAILGSGLPCYSQPDSTWNKWTPMIGEWTGTGSGQPGSGGGKFSFFLDLDKKILVRKNHAEYPSTNNKQGIIHDDLMIIYPGSGYNPDRAIYFDNEGHVINYAITLTDSSIVFISDKVKNLPRFRLTYFLPVNKMMNVKFEISGDGNNYKTYVDGNCMKSD